MACETQYASTMAWIPGGSDREEKVWSAVLCQKRNPPFLDIPSCKTETLVFVYASVRASVHAHIEIHGYSLFMIHQRVVPS